MFIPVLLSLFSAFHGIHAQAVDAFGITLDEKIEAMEIQLLDPTTLNFLVSPCSTNFGDDPNRGEQTSAQWVRIVFHDMVTKNIAGPGLGGLDASIGWESNRPENIGVFVNVTLGQFTQFTNAFLSMSDLIGLGLSDALASCDPTARRLQLRVGRMDATGPGPAGVPGPENKLPFAQAAFTKAGFSNSEMIQSVACGHSLGGVHHSNFPNIVPELNDPTNLESRASWDTTPAAFDPNQINEYLDRTGKKGGPLVNGPALTNSDDRIFKSDGNATITAMRTATAFRNTCFTIFEKMLNTVPSAVTLSSPIGPRPWIFRKSSLDLNSNGQVTFSGVIIGNSKTAALPTTAAYQYSTIGGGNTGPKTSQTGANLPIIFGTNIGFGTIRDYPFNDVLNSPSITSVTVQGSYTATVNQNIFIMPSQSFRSDTQFSNNVAFGANYAVRAAVLSSLAPGNTVVTAKMWYMVKQPNSVVPKLLTTSVSMTLKSTLGSYKIYQATFSFGTLAVPIGSLATIFQVSLGSTQLSSKQQSSGWAVCNNVDMKTC